jgi:outer membrane beta-barrel protein
MKIHLVAVAIAFSFALNLRAQNEPTVPSVPPVQEEDTSLLPEAAEETQPLSEVEASDIKSFAEKLDQNLPSEKGDLEIKKEQEVLLSPTVPFSNTESILVDMGAIQRNYMPKSKRFQWSGWGQTVASDVLYNTFGLGLRSGYNFNELWGIEFSGNIFSSSRAKEAQDLETKQAASLSNVATIRNLYSLQLNLSSIYGKFELFDHQIIPFEFYQFLGIGQVQDARSKASSSVNFGVGQMFTLDRSTALRVELSGLVYKAQTVSGASADSTLFLLQVGLSRFTPEPVYR